MCPQADQGPGTLPYSSTRLAGADVHVWARQAFCFQRSVSLRSRPILGGAGPRPTTSPWLLNAALECL